MIQNFRIYRMRNKERHCKLFNGLRVVRVIQPSFHLDTRFSCIRRAASYTARKTRQYCKLYNRVQNISQSFTICNLLLAFHLRIVALRIELAPMALQHGPRMEWKTSDVETKIDKQSMSCVIMMLSKCRSPIPSKYVAIQYLTCTITQTNASTWTHKIVLQVSGPTVLPQSWS